MVTKQRVNPADYVSLTQASQTTGYSVYRLGELVDQGKVRSTRFLNRRMIHRDELKALAARHAALEDRPSPALVQQMRRLMKRRKG